MKEIKIRELVDNELFADGDWVESKDQDPNGDIRLIQLADIGDGHFIDKSWRFMNRGTAERLKCTYLKKNDVLVARMPDLLGRCCLFPFDDDEKYVTVVDVCILRPDDRVNRNYLKYAINSPSIRQAISRQSTGTTRTRITKKKIGDLKILLPPLEEQKKIAAILDSADALRQKDKGLIAKYEELTQSLFLDMFGDPVTNPKGWGKSEVIKQCSCIVPGRDKPKSFTGKTPWVTTEDLKHLGYTEKSKKEIGLSLEEIATVKAKVIPAGRL